MFPSPSMGTCIDAAELGMPSGPTLSLMVAMCGGGACCTCTAWIDLGMLIALETMGAEVGGCI
jgi:hypothetical protein